MALSPTVAAWKAKQPNGSIPAGELQEIPGTYDVDLNGTCRFMPEAARSFNAMREAMRERGLSLSPSRTYRTLPMQQAKWNDYLARGKKPPVVAFPGTSNHGEALAGDMGFGTYTDARFKWLSSNASDYGWHNNDASGEPWHWDYEGDYAPRFNFKEAEDEMTPEQQEKLAFAFKFANEVANETQSNGPIAAGKKVARTVNEKPPGSAPGGHCGADCPCRKHEHEVKGKAS